MLTETDVQMLKRPFTADEHSAREGGKNKDRSKAMWVFYVEEDAIIERLYEVDPSWSLDITAVHMRGGYVSCYGTLTVCGVTRAGVGTNSPNRDGDPVGENEEKGAATDLLKRLARLFGVGLYLKRAPKPWCVTSMNSREAEKKALGELAAWLQSQAASSSTVIDWKQYQQYVHAQGLTMTEVRAALKGRTLTSYAYEHGKGGLVTFTQGLAEQKQLAVEADAAHADGVPEPLSA